MRHRVAHRKLGRVTEHRIALLRNQAQMLLRHERIQTTVPKAKSLRPFVERLITVAKRGITDGAQSERAVHARRLVRRDLVDRETASKLFDTIAPRFASRPGGYTRLLRVGHRRGDGAEIAQVELLGSEYQPRVETPQGAEAEAGNAKGVGGRLRAAAQRMRGQKTAKPAQAKAADQAAGEQADRPGRAEDRRPGKKTSRKQSS